MDNSISIISGIRDKAHRFIELELQRAGIDGLVVSHGEIIVQLLKNDKMNKSELAQKIGRDKATVTALVDKLIKKGFVIQEKSHEDNRYTNISLTDKGREFKDIFHEISKNMYSVEYKGLTNEEREVFLSLAEKIYRNFHNILNSGEEMPEKGKANKGV